MKNIAQLLRQRNLKKGKKLGEKDVFYIFTRTMKELYGNKGIENIKPCFYKGGKIFVKSNSSIWANEVWLNQKEILEKMKNEAGAEEIKEIKISSN